MSNQDEIVYQEMPEWITYDDIHELLWKAHEENRKAGFILATTQLTGEELKDRVGPEGTTLVALSGDQLVGTLSFHPNKKKVWYIKGKSMGLLLGAVHPDFQGKHINSNLFKLSYDYARKDGCTSLELDTADHNDHAIKVFEHLGFVKVSYKANKGRDHYSVNMMKWLDECPFSPFYISLRYHLKRALVRLRYTPDKKKRFGI